MARAKIGVIVMMLKQNFQDQGIYETFRSLKDIGYSSVEISQLAMTPENVAEIRRACDDFGIEVAAMSAGLEPSVRPAGAPQRPNMPRMENLAEDYDKIVADAKALDCTFLRMGMLPIQYLGSKEGLIEFANKADAMSDRLAQDGISFYYHTHHFEFVRYDGQFALDIIRDNSHKIGFELDVHWIWRGGMDPAKFVRTYDGRVKLLHLKDYRIGQLTMGGDMRQAMAELVQFAEVGEGTLDMPAIIEAGLESGAQYLIIEQDQTYGRDPLESLRISAENLRKMGYADCF
ncbi:MAG: sugar phosphate isomerase/epimerase [Chloroflexi bacterium]|nr:sugar phosphate isomerase/epimerase [Chloroflexota bacterium]